MNNKRRYNSADEGRRETGYHYSNRNPNEYRYKRDNQSRDDFRPPENPRENHRSPRYGSEASDYYRSPRQETETRNNYRSPRQDFEARDQYRSPRPESEAGDNQQSPRPDFEARDDNRRRGSVHDPRDQKRARYDWKTEKIKELEKTNEEMKAELSEMKEKKDVIQKNYDHQKEKIDAFVIENDAYKAGLKHELETTRNSCISTEQRLKNEKELTKNLSQQNMKLRKDIEDSKTSNEINIRKANQQKDEVIRKLQNQLNDERLKNNSVNKLNNDLKRANDKCNELIKINSQLKIDYKIELTQTKNNHNSIIVALKKSKKYYQNSNEQNKRTKLAVLYKQKLQEQMYKKNPRVIYEATESNTNRVAADYGEKFMQLFKDMNRELNNKNLDTMIGVINSNVKESLEINKGKKILEKRLENDRIMCPRPNCGKTFACSGDFCKHMALKHFLPMNDKDIPSEKSRKKARNPEVIEIRDSDFVSD